LLVKRSLFETLPVRAV